MRDLLCLGIAAQSGSEAGGADTTVTTDSVCGFPAEVLLRFRARRIFSNCIGPLLF